MFHVWDIFMTNTYS